MSRNSQKVLAFTTAGISEPCSRLRVYQYSDGFKARGLEVRVQPFMSEYLYLVKNRRGVLWQIVKAALLSGCVLRRLWAIANMTSYQTLLVQKESFPWGGAWVERRAKSHGMRLIYDIDDGVFLQHEMAGGWRRLWWDANRVPDIMRIADEVIVGCESLSHYARQFSNSVHVVGTAVPDRYFDISTRDADSEPLRVGWIGTQPNLRYLSELAPALTEAWKQVPFELWIVGGPNVAEFEIDLVPVHSRVWTEDSETECLGAIDIGIMPLATDEWTKYKCGYKLIQYMAAGRVAIASAVGVNTTLIVDQLSGVLCSDDDVWIDALVQLLGDSNQRAAIAHAGRQSVQGYRASIIARRVADIVFDGRLDQESEN